MTFTAGTIKRIHINQHQIRKNNKTGCRANVITVQWKNKSYPVKTISIKGESAVVYAPDKPLKCGARVWLETTAEVLATL